MQGVNNQQNSSLEHATFAKDCSTISTLSTRQIAAAEQLVVTMNAGPVDGLAN